MQVRSTLVEDLRKRLRLFGWKSSGGVRGIRLSAKSDDDLMWVLRAPRKGSV